MRIVVGIVLFALGSVVAAGVFADQRAEWFSLTGIVSAYDAALAKSPGLSRWAIAGSAAAFHQGGSDERMFGGDLAWWFARGAPETGLSVGQAREFLDAQVLAVMQPAWRSCRDDRRGHRHPCSAPAGHRSHRRRGSADDHRAIARVGDPVRRAGRRSDRSVAERRASGARIEDRFRRSRDHGRGVESPPAR